MNIAYDTECPDCHGLDLVYTKYNGITEYVCLLCGCQWEHNSFLPEGEKNCVIEHGNSGEYRDPHIW